MSHAPAFTQPAGAAAVGSEARRAADAPAEQTDLEGAAR